MRTERIKTVDNTKSAFSPRSIVAIKVLCCKVFGLVLNFSYSTVLLSRVQCGFCKTLSIWTGCRVDFYARLTDHGLLGCELQN